MSQLSELLGRSTKVEFGGCTWTVCPLTFNDLCDLEERFGDVGDIDLSRASTQRYLLWLVLRAPGEGQKRFESEQMLGSLLALDDPRRTSEFVAEVFRLCGLTSGQADQLPGTHDEGEKKEASAPRKGSNRKARGTVISAAQ